MTKKRMPINIFVGGGDGYKLTAELCRQKRDPFSERDIKVFEGWHKAKVPIFRKKKLARGVDMNRRIPLDIIDPNTGELSEGYLWTQSFDGKPCSLIKDSKEMLDSKDVIIADLKAQNEEIKNQLARREQKMDIAGDKDKTDSAMEDLIDRFTTFQKKMIWPRREE